MKKMIFCLAALMISGGVFAQVDTTIQKKKQISKAKVQCESHCIKKGGKVGNGLNEGGSHTGIVSKEEEGGHVGHGRKGIEGTRPSGN